VIGKIEVGFDTDRPNLYEANGGIPEKTRSLLNRFIREHLTDALIQSPDIQKAFSDWMKERADRDVSKATQRKELKDTRNFARKNKLDLLEVHMDNLLLDTRNNVQNLQRNFEVSRLITQETVGRLMAYFNDDSGRSFTKTEYEAIQLFLLTCMTGLRTIEWSTVQMVLPPCEVLPGETEALPHLVVQSAKTKTEEGRIRHLILDAFTPAQLESLNHTIQYARSITSGVRSSLVVRARKVLQYVYRHDPAALELIRTLDFRAARKIFTVELRRGGASAREAAAALGHTSLNNVRYYNHGDISCPRLTKLPLARAPKGIAETIKDPLETLNQARQAQGQKPIYGYPEAPRTGHADIQNDNDDNGTPDDSKGSSLMDKL